MNIKKVGKLFTSDGKDVWRLISYCGHLTNIIIAIKYFLKIIFIMTQSTVTFENVETKERIGGAVGCLNVKNFKELIIKKEVK